MSTLAHVLSQFLWDLSNTLTNNKRSEESAHFPVLDIVEYVYLEFVLYESSSYKSFRIFKLGNNIYITFFLFFLMHNVFMSSAICGIKVICSNGCLNYLFMSFL